MRHRMLVYLDDAAGVVLEKSALRVQWLLDVVL